MSEILLLAFWPLPRFITSTTHHCLQSRQGKTEQMKGARKHFHLSHLSSQEAKHQPQCTC